MMSSANNDSFTSAFLIWMSLISFSCLIALARTSNTVFNTMSNKGGERGHPCLVPDLRGKDFSFSSLSMTLAVGLSYMVFIMLRYIECHFYFFSHWALSHSSQAFFILSFLPLIFFSHDILHLYSLTFYIFLCSWLNFFQHCAGTLTVIQFTSKNKIISSFFCVLGECVLSPLTLGCAESGFVFISMTQLWMEVFSFCKLKKSLTLLA